MNMREVPFEGFPMVTPVGSNRARPANVQDYEFTQPDKYRNLKNRGKSPQL
jgi:hypothetical protein